MSFVDEVTIDARGGDGGNGAVAFRREKYVPLGGPSGGDGGNGGDIIFVGDERLTTLLDFRFKKHLTGKHGENGRSKDAYGAGAPHAIVRVPVGTQVFDAETGVLRFDIDREGLEVVIAKGGRGGRGNIHFTTPIDRAPRRAEKGAPGEACKLRLELKMLADVGLVGYPNVGKSTLISVVSRARPKIANYPFTTLVPNLGVASVGDDQSFVIADIPGIIEGAADGAGLGLRFLKHIERTRVLLYMISLDPDPARKPLADFDILRHELERFDPELATRPFLVAITKLDLPDVQQRVAVIKTGLKKRGVKSAVHTISAATNEGVEVLMRALYTELQANPVPPKPRQVPLLKRGETLAVEDGELEIKYV